MTTSYTAPIKAGHPLFRFRDFALRCAHGIDFASSQRDDGLDTPLREETLDPGYIERVTAAADDLRAALQRDAPQWSVRFQGHKISIRKQRQDAERKITHLRQAYDRMLADVDSWEPPTPMHAGLKDFMREQLKSSIMFDCPDPLHLPRELATAEEYREHEIARLTEDLQYRQRELTHQQKRVAEQNDWIRTLWASLAAHPHPATALAADKEAS